MCGIAGYLDLATPDRRRAPEALPDLERMTRLLAHRGPDDEGFFRDGPVGLGMRRLSIIDLETGDQPMTAETDDVQVIHNGEIYNFRELRAELAAAGHRFATASDTEVLAHGWEEWGEGLPARLRGMFAFAIWDRRAGTLFLARDHFGIKPLYLARDGDLLLFASEIKALLAWPGVGRDLDLPALDQYLSLLYVPEPRTIYQAVRVLPAGSAMICKGGRTTTARYWRFRPEPGRFGCRAEAVEAVRETFADSVRAMLVADVPVGIFLSGGVDSASILAMAARAGARPLRTFSLGFGRREHRWDELAPARALARQFGSEHHEFEVEPDVVALLPEVVRHFDQPFANPTAVLLYLLAGETRREVKVALAGTGGDELFAGYPRYLAMRLYRRYRLLPAPLRRAAAAAAARWLRDAGDGRLGAQRARRFFAGGALPFAAAYAQLVTAVDGERKLGLYSAEFAARLAAASAGSAGSRGDAEAVVRDLLDDDGGAGGGVPPLERLMAADLETYLVGNQLAYGDRMSMARSLEVRVPFVDQRLIEVAGGIPLAWNLRRGRREVTKGLFREAMAPFLPPAVLAAPKRGLNLPIGPWFRGGQAGWLDDLLSPERLRRRGLFRPEAVAAVVAEHRSGRRDHSLFLWALATLEVWQQHCVDDG